MEEREDEELVEATLFLAGRFLSMQDLVKFTNLNPLTIRENIIKLKEKYESHGTMQIIEKEDCFKMDVKAHCAHLINKIATGSTEFTKAEQETLAIIAYKQPITQATVVKIRGNKAYEHIKRLVQAGLIRTKKAGRTIDMQTDESFYDYFNVSKREVESSEESEEAEKVEDATENNNKTEDNLTLPEKTEENSDILKEEKA